MSLSFSMIPVQDHANLSVAAGHRFYDLMNACFGASPWTIRASNVEHMAALKALALTDVDAEQPFNRILTVVKRCGAVRVEVVG